MKIKAGDKVVCINDLNFRLTELFPELVQQGHLYIIEKVRVNGIETIIDIRGIIPERMENGILPGFKPHRFKKV